MRAPARPLRAKHALVLSSVLAVATVALALGPASALATQSPIAAYSLDEGSGEVVHDLYGNHDGEIENGPTENSLPEWSQGKYGSALWFEGKGYQCVTVPHSPDLELTGDFTVEAWVKPEGTGEQEPLIVKEAPTFESHTAYMLYLGLEESGEIGGYVEEPGWERPEVTSKQLPIGKWSHLALSFDGESLRLYLNGALVDTSAAEGAQPSEGPLKFACAEVFGHDYKGKLDEVRIYDRAISEEEVQRDEETALQTPPVSQQPVAAYSFDKGEGTIAEDLAGERDATIEGATWARGRFGDSLEFDGVNDVVTIPASPGLHIEEEFTLEAWVRPSGENKYAPLITKATSGSEAEPYFLYEGGWKSNLPYGGLESETENETYSSADGTTGQIPENAWAHLALSFDGAKTRLYVDGELVDEDAGFAPAISAGAIEIGGSTEESPDDHYFKGRIDEVRIYNRALGAGEIGGDRGTGVEAGPTGPVAAYAFDEGEGSSAVDTTGNEHTATLEGPEWARGRYGTGLEFKASEEDAVTIAASSQLDFSEEFTLEAWVRPSTNLNKYAPLIVHQATGSEAQPYFLYEGSWESNLPYGGLEGETESETFSVADDPLPQQAWSHVALSFDGAKTRLYVNGALVDEGAGAPPAVSEGNLEIGAATEGGLDEYFDGRIDEARLYDRALSEGEIEVSKATPIQAPQQGPVAAYSFDEGEGSALEGITGAGHTGVIEGATWARGRFGGGLEFDGEEDCVAIPATADLQFSEEFTLEAWVRPVGSEEDARPVISMADESAPGGEAPYAYDLRAGQSEVPKAWVRKGGEAGFRGAYGEEPLPESAWSHIALTDDGSVIRLYVDGVLGDEENSTNVAPLLTAAQGPLQIGCDVFGASFKGRIDEVRIYNRALDAGEIGADRGTGIEAGPTGPVAAYAFDEGSGETAVDTTGNQHTATLEGPSWARGRYGGGLEFSAAQEDAVTIAPSPQLDFSEEFTLEAWVRPSAAENKYAPLIVHQSTGSDDQPYFLYEGSWTTNLPYGGLESNTENETFSHADEPLPQNAWSHVALSFDGAKTRLYVNGQLVDEGAGSPPSVSEGDLQIGAASELGSYFDGRIDEARIYDRALSEGEIEVSKATPIQAPQQGPVAAYSFDEGEGSTVEDLTGEGHTGTIEGAEWARGKYGGSLEFDGEEDCVTIPATEDLQLTEEFTIEAWVRPVGWGEEALPVISMADENSPGTEAPYAYELLAGQNEKPKAWVRKGGESGFRGVYGEEPLPQNAWSHLALTGDGSVIRLYVDGKLGTEESSTNVAPLLTTAEGPLEIGCGPVNGSFKGRIDEVRAYNRALDEGEILGSTRPLPVIKTTEAYGVEETEAALAGTVDPQGVSTTYYFEYGSTSSYGQTVPANPALSEEVVTGNRPKEVEEAVSGLQPETEVHYRIVAKTKSGTVFGKDRVFLTGKATSTPAEREKARHELLAKTASWKGFVGLNWTGNPKKDSTAESMKLVEESGAPMFRVVIKEPNNNMYDPETTNKELYDQIFRAAAQHGVTILPNIVGLEGQGNLMPSFKPGTAGRFEWEQKLKAIVGRYGSGGTFWSENEGLTELAPEYWEIWNEPNYGENGDLNEHVDGKRYGELLEISRDVLDEVEPSARILFGGLLTVGKKEGKVDKETVGEFIKEAGHYGDYSALSLHPYAFRGIGKSPNPTDGKDVAHVTESVEQNIRKARFALERLRKAAGGTEKRKIWITELGWPINQPGAKEDGSHYLVSQEVQRELLNATFNMIKERSAEVPESWNIQNVWYYNLRDWVTGNHLRKDWSYHSGLVEDIGFGEKGNKRKAWTAFQNQAK